MDSPTARTGRVDCTGDAYHPSVALNCGLDMESCLENRLQRFVTLTESEKKFIAYMEREERDVSRRETILQIGKPAEELHVIKYGWVIVRSCEHRGKRTIVRIYLPGEIVGLAEIGKGEAIHAIEALTDGRICPFPRSAVSEMYEEAPRVAALLTALGSLEQLELRERIHGLARLSAEDRVAHFLLTLQDRLAVANHGHSRRFQLPLTHAQLGDFLGLTDIYVSRTLKKLIEDKHIEHHDRHVTIVDRNSWADRLGHKDLYQTIDTSWFPNPSDAAQGS